MFVLRNHNRIALTLGNRHRHNLLRQTARRLGRCRLGLAGVGKGILIHPRNLEFIRDVLSGFRHGIDAVLRLHRAVYKPPADGGVIDFSLARKRGVGLWHHHGRARHAFHTARNDDAHFTRAYGPRRGDDRIHARPAQTVHGRSRNRGRQPRQQRRHARDVAIILTRLIGAAVDDFVNHRGVQIGARDQLTDRDRAQIVSAHAG